MYGLDDITINKIKEVFASFPDVDNVILYGSRAKGNYKTGSDIDLTLKGENIDLGTINQISSMLDDLLLPYTFDISVFSHIKSDDLLNHINRVGLVFFSRKGFSETSTH